MLMMFGSRVAALAEWRQEVATRMQAVMCAKFILLANKVSPSPLGSDTYASKTTRTGPCSMHMHALTSSCCIVSHELVPRYSLSVFSRTYTSAISETLTWSVGRQQDVADRREAVDNQQVIT